MAGTNMKKLVFFFTLLFLLSEGIFSIEIKELSEKTIILENQRIFPEMYYFGKNIMLSGMKFIGKHDIIPVFDDEKDFLSYGVNPSGYFILNKRYFNSNFDKLYFVITNPEENITLFVYEISIHDNDIVEKNKLSFSEFENIKPNLIKYERIFNKQLLNQYVFKADYEKKYGNWYPYFIIEDPEQNVSFDFRNYSKEFVNGIFAINSIGNRISYITEDKDTYVNDCYKKYSLHELAIIYDAVCNDDNVRIRTEPNLCCKTLGKLKRNDSVKIIDSSMQKFIMNDDEFYWHKIETSDGKVGWVYGKYLDIEK